MSKVRAGIDIDALTKELDELCSHVTPSEVALRIYELEKDHSQYVVDKYQRFVAQSEAYFDLLVRTVDYINYIEKSGWPQHKPVQFLLMAHNLKPLFSAFDRLMKGYYEDSNILLRTPYEAFFRMLFISLNPDDTYHSFAPRKKGLKQFQLTNFVTQQLGLDWHHYSVMSSIAHANQFNVLSELKRIANEGQKEPITLSFKFDEFMFSMGVNQLGFLLLLYLRAVMVLFLGPDRKPAGIEFAQKCSTHIDLYQKFFASHVNPHWHAVAKDTEDIFEMLTEVEAGNDWRAVWKRLRDP